MSYTLERLAPGSYDVLLDGEPVASLVSETGRRSLRTTWLVVLLTDSVSARPPAPFTKGLHKFDSLGGACAWLGIERHE